MEDYNLTLKIKVLFKEPVHILNEAPIELNDPVKSSVFIIMPIQTDGIKKIEIEGSFSFKIDNELFKAFEAKTDSIICVHTEKDDDIKSFCDDNYQKCVDKIESLFKVLRYQYQLGNKNTITIEKREAFWSLNNENWFSLVECAPIDYMWIRWIDNLPINKETIEQLIQNNITEPVYQELIREAVELQTTNLRSAFVIAVAALETAIKTFISIRIPISSYLIENIQSPPIDKLLVSYLPQLEPRLIFTFSRKTITTIIERRNKLVHLGQVTFTRIEAFKDIELIKDIIHIIDHFLGHPRSISFQRENRVKQQASVPVTAKKDL